MIRRAAILIVACLAASCQALLSVDELPSVPYDELPIDRIELLKVADRVYRTSRRVRDLVRARTALRKAEFVDPGHFGTAWRLARVDGILARVDVDNAAPWAREGLEAGEAARAKKPERVAGHLYTAICAGLLAKARPTEADTMMAHVVEAAEKAILRDPDFGHGEARRVLGAIYLYAPSWPSGVGDIDEAMAVLEGVATAHPEDPSNLFYLAEAYRRAGDRQKAVALYKRVLKAPKEGIWALEGPQYRADARAHLIELGE